MTRKGPPFRVDAVAISFVVAILLAVLHIYASWGHITFFWGDYGRWLHEVGRFSQGEIPYRDFYWPYPPLALWLVGAVAALFEPSTRVVWLAMASLVVAIAALYWRYVSLVTDRGLQPLVVAAGLIFAFAQSNILSAPLSVGTYSPSMPVGMFFLLSGLMFMFGLETDPRWHRAGGLGVCCGLAALAKQDFWLPALWLVLSPALLVPAGTRRLNLRIAAIAVGASGAVFVAGVAIVGLTAGWKLLPGVVTGFGALEQNASRSVLTWERLFAALAALGIAGVCTVSPLVLLRSVPVRPMLFALLSLAAVAAIAVTVHVGMSVMTARKLDAARPVYELTATEKAMRGAPDQFRSQVRAGVVYLSKRLEIRRVPALGPPIVLAILLIFWRRVPDQAVRRRLLILVGLCIAARSRRMGEFTEWYHVLLELPVYAYALQLLWRGDRRGRAAASIACTGVLAAALLTYWQLGVGHWTRRGVQTPVDTPNGRIWIIPGSAENYRRLRAAVEEIDPDGSMPVFAFGPIGGFSYFLQRPDPVPLTQGFALSRWPPEEITRQLVGLPKLILIDNSELNSYGQDCGGFSLTRWDMPHCLNHYGRIERPYFEPLIKNLAPYRTIAANGAWTELTLYVVDRHVPLGAPAATAR